MATPAGWGREGNLPAELTTFVGRTRLLTTICRGLRENRLVTITGIGGVGKTRTALRIAHTVRHLYPGGVWYVDLARLQDPALIVHAVTASLGIADQSARPEIDALADWLSSRTALLLVDTCEHLVDACAKTLETLLDRSDGLTVLSTSRQSLGVPGEQVVPIPPLTLPGDIPDENPLANESVRLFEERASAALSGFAVDQANIGPVSELCRRLDGIPLAIELAAVRLRALSVEQILDLLADRFSLLAGASRTALPRHRTLRTAIGWSHELCEPAERLLWARLSVFSGDFELEAARYVCESDALPSDDIPDLVAGLVEKSVLIRRGDQAGVRHRLIDTLREYGAEWLGKLGETETIRRRHRDYYLQLAERGEHAWSGPRQVYWFVRMRQEYHNIRAALEYCLADPAEAQIGLELLSSLWFMWVACGFSREGRFYLQRTLMIADRPSKARCKALWVLSYIRGAQGDATGAVEAAEQCHSDALQVGDSGAVILAAKMLGTAAWLQGDLHKAKALLGAAIESHRNGRELNPGLLPAVVELSVVLTIQNEPAEAEKLLQDCLDVCADRNELWIRSYGHYALAEAQRAMGRTSEAMSNATEALRLKRYFHDVLGIVLAVELLARLAVDLGRPERAAQLLGGAQTNWRFFGLPQLGSPFFTLEHEQCVKECRQALGDETYERLFQRGAGLGLDDVIDFAMDVQEAPEPKARM
jgi:predicted ATPase